MIDLLLINPGNAKGTYQGLSQNISAIETPTWLLLLAQSCRSVGFSVSIIDVNAEKIEFDEIKSECGANSNCTIRGTGQEYTN